MGEFYERIVRFNLGRQVADPEVSITQMRENSGLVYDLRRVTIGTLPVG